MIGTLKNALGLHLGKNARGTAWPRVFQTGPKGSLPHGTTYDSVGSGLFAPLVFQQASSR